MRFEVTQEESAKIAKWLKDVVYPPIIERQFKDPESYRMLKMFCTDENGLITTPYLGAIGGGLTYEFTPTSIGTVFMVRFGDKELNLTDYDSW